jgi:hypothetical protein
MTEWRITNDQTSEAGAGSALIGDFDVLGLFFAEGEMVAADAEFDGVAEGGTADDFDLHAAAESHLEQAPAKFGIASDGDDVTLAADTEVVKAARFDAAGMIAGMKPARFFHEHCSRG